MYIRQNVPTQTSYRSLKNVDILFINRIKSYNKEIAKRLLLLNNTLLHSSNGMGGILHQYSDCLRIDDNDDKNTLMPLLIIMIQNWIKYHRADLVEIQLFNVKLN